jgi:large subunit ribosomal protein L35
MPKLKTKKAAKKRYKVTANGKIKISKRGRRHLLTKKSASRKRNLAKAGILKKSETKRARKLLPYS